MGKQIGTSSPRTNLPTGIIIQNKKGYEANSAPPHKTAYPVLLFPRHFHPFQRATIDKTYAISTKGHNRKPPNPHSKKNTVNVTTEISENAKPTLRF
jgi:hypothetical protein